MAFVDEMVVVAADQGKVRQVRETLVLDEEVEVVRFAPVRPAVAAGEHAATVADDEGSALVGGGEADGASHLEHGAVGAEHDAGDATVAGEAAGHVHRDGSGAGDLAGAEVERVGGIGRGHKAESGEVERIGWLTRSVEVRAL